MINNKVVNTKNEVVAPRKIDVVKQNNQDNQRVQSTIVEVEKIVKSAKLI